jgi:hypothetical protein
MGGDWVFVFSKPLPSCSEELRVIEISGARADEAREASIPDARFSHAQLIW